MEVEKLLELICPLDRMYMHSLVRDTAPNEDIKNSFKLDTLFLK
jgi:hypothetical protein